ncbi:hypothetical protein BGZ65_004552 [Modicella reniformis]|uniref:Adhesin domain-containing protein n=1 Tax=Modicella reniformis TaxID=1440133 RepID=A0A9P6INA8_9FUNG|nr:hypothetical protein BGZ65_004552 [Modicella reniformis]
MTSNCCNSNPPSQNPPTFCVHNDETERQSLLGYHAHQTHLQQQQQQLPQHEQGDYRIDMKDGKGQLPINPCVSNCKKTRKRKFWYIIGLILVIGFYYAFTNNHHRNHHLAMDGSHNSGSSINGDGEVVIIHDSCINKAIDWDSLKSFATNAQNFRLKLGKGSFGSRIKIHTGNVQQPTLLLDGKISPLKGGQPEFHTEGEMTIISHLGLHVLIKDINNLFDTEIWFEDRWVENELARGYRACATLEIEIVLPESYTAFGSITVHGNLASINAYDLGGIVFQNLDFGAAVGDVNTRGDILADTFKVQIITGKSEIESLHTSDQKPLDVNVQTTTGLISLALTANLITGAMGIVKASIQLFNEDQVLNLAAKASMGTVDAVVSDEFLGRFQLKTSLGVTNVESTAKGSNSEIKYEKLSHFFKSGVKVKKREENHSKGEIDLTSTLGRVTLQFTN